MHLVFFGWLLFLSFLIMFTKETEQKTNSWVKSINGLMDRPRCLTSCLIFQALCYCITIFLHILIPTKCQFFLFWDKKDLQFFKTTMSKRISKNSYSWMHLQYRKIFWVWGKYAKLPVWKYWMIYRYIYFKLKL